MAIAFLKIAFHRLGKTLWMTVENSGDNLRKSRGEPVDDVLTTPAPRGLGTGVERLDVAPRPPRPGTT
jgi:hypothetical protein